MSIFSIEYIFFEIWAYKVSYLEFFGVVFGLISVFFASKVQLLTWPFGLLNIFCSVLLYFQAQLYPDMFLQFYYLFVTIYGWIHWNSTKKDLNISKISKKKYKFLILGFIVSTILMGYFFSNIHTLIPSLFLIPTAFPYADSFVMLASILAMKWMAEKKIECWILWIVVNLVCIVLYFKKELYFLSAEYFLFLILALYGYFFWHKKMMTKISDSE